MFKYQLHDMVPVQLCTRQEAVEEHSRNLKSFCSHIVLKTFPQQSANMSFASLYYLPNGLPYTRRYFNYLDEPFLWSRYPYSIPYWVRLQDEYERSRTSLRYMEDMIDDMIAKARAVLGKTSSVDVATTSSSTYTSSSSSSSYVPTYVPTYVPSLAPYVPTPITTTHVDYKTLPSRTYVPSSTYTSSLSNYDLDREIAAWKTAMSAMHSSMYSLRSRTETMGSRIGSSMSDSERTRILTTEFGIESLMSDLEEKRREAEDVCSRIHDALNMPKPAELFVGKYYKY
jgi:hypothetical protein